MQAVPGGEYLAAIADPGLPEGAGVLPLQHLAVTEQHQLGGGHLQGGTLECTLLGSTWTVLYISEDYIPVKCTVHSCKVTQPELYCTLL